MSGNRREVEDTLRAVDELPDVDQARMNKMARLMSAKRWPHDIEAMVSWTPAEFRAAVDKLCEE